MADHLDGKTRSDLMSRIGSTNTEPELIVRRILWRNGIRYRLHRRDLPGRPDVTITKLKTVIFVHGCYWHRHPGCKRASTPNTNMEFWTKKFEDNVARDVSVQDQLQELGWNVLIVWSCETRTQKGRSALEARLLGQLDHSPE